MCSKYPKILEYQTKINTNKNNIKECIICYKTSIHIQFNCGHELCIDCYLNVDRCFIDVKKLIF